MLWYIDIIFGLKVFPNKLLHSLVKEIVKK